MTWSFERRLLGAALVAWAVVAAIQLWLGPPLGHDEAAFAIVARGDSEPWLYRSRGVTLLAELGLALGGADWQMRLASALLGLGVVPAVFAVGRAAFSARTGAWAAAVIAGAHPMAIRSAALLGDLPATAAALAGLAILATELARPGGPRWRVALAAPAFAAAFYLRYATAPVIAIAGIAALAVWWRPIRARPLPIAATAAAFAALLVPHIAHSVDHTGAVLGVLRASAEVPARAYPGEGLVSYVTANPFAYYGALVGPLIIAGLAGLALRLRSRPAWFLAAVAIGQLIAIGLQSHAQPRYIFIASTLLAVLGVETLRSAVAPRRPRLARLAVPAAVLAWLAVAIAAIPLDRSVARSRRAITAAADAIRADRRTGPCIAIASQVPQLMWYARCRTVLARVVEPDALQPGRDRYLVSTRYAPLDGPSFAAAHQLRIVELATGTDRAHVWAIR